MSAIILFTHIHAPIARCFDLSRSIELHMLSTAHTNETAVAGKTSGLINRGETVTWEAVHFGIKQQLSVQIVEMNAPVFFSDRMLKGAFKSMYHEHHFMEHAATTLMKDVFNYEVPFNFVGKVFDNLVLRNYMKHLLLKRNLVIKTLAEGTGWQQVL